MEPGGGATAVYLFVDPSGVPVGPGARQRERSRVLPVEASVLSAASPGSGGRQAVPSLGPAASERPGRRRRVWPDSGLLHRRRGVWAEPELRPPWRALLQQHRLPQLVSDRWLPLSRPRLDPPSCSLQDDAGGRRLAAHGLHLPTGDKHDGGRPGDPAGVRAAGHRVRLWPKEGRNGRLPAHQLSAGRRRSGNSGRPFKAAVILVRKTLGAGFFFTTLLHAF